MPNPGALRFNTDSLKMELFDGNQWVELVATSADSQTGGARGVFGGGDPGASPSLVNVMDYITISTTGNAIDFGDLTTTCTIAASCASSVRGLFAGGYRGGALDSNVIDYITISSTGNAIDFGDKTIVARGVSGASSSTRGVFFGGVNTTPGLIWYNVIDYVTIASTGNAQDFGDTTSNRIGLNGACSSSTRALVAGGQTPGGVLNSIDFITISSLGNAADFGDLTSAKGGPAASSNSVRGIWGGGYTPINNVIEFVTISTLGNAQDFGDLTAAKNGLGSCSSSTRGVWGGGSTPTIINVIEYVTIMSAGNAIDFGDLTGTRQRGPALSNGHGGL